MQPRNDEAAAVAELPVLDGAADADDAADVVVVAAGALDVLLPHAAITRLAATAAAAAINAEFFTVSSTERGCGAQARRNFPQPRLPED
jgi:hypothetical protein